MTTRSAIAIAVAAWCLSAEFGVAGELDAKADTTVRMPAGSFVTHFARQVHWDGAKDEETIIQIVGDGPATSTRVEDAK